MQSESPLFSTRERLLAKFEALLDESDLIADNAEYGQTFNLMEAFFLDKGRKLLQETSRETPRACPAYRNHRRSQAVSPL